MRILRSFSWICWEYQRKWFIQSFQQELAQVKSLHMDVDIYINLTIYIYSFYFTFTFSKKINILDLWFPASRQYPSSNNFCYLAKYSLQPFNAILDLWHFSRWNNFYRHNSFCAIKRFRRNTYNFSWNLQFKRMLNVWVTSQL